MATWIWANGFLTWNWILKLISYTYDKMGWMLSICCCKGFIFFHSSSLGFSFITHSSVREYWQISNENWYDHFNLRLFFHPRFSGSPISMIADMLLLLTLLMIDFKINVKGNPPHSGIDYVLIFFSLSTINRYSIDCFGIY